MDQDSGSLLSGWVTPSDETVASVKRKVLEAIHHKDIAALIASYYNPAGNFAGATFLGIEPNPDDSIAASDLHALRMLSIDVGPKMTRRLLFDSQRRDRLAATLSALPTDLDLVGASASDLLAMEQFYIEAKRAVSDGDAWVTATKLCARKRPRLFPIMDNKVRDFLGLTKFKNYQVNWLVFTVLLADREIADGIDWVFEAARKLSERVSNEWEPDDLPIKRLDAVLWRVALATA